MNGPEEYLETQVMTATPHQLHLMVVDGAIRFAAQAEEALEKEDFEVSHLALNRSREFVTELVGGLEAEQSPELVVQLKNLFLYAYKNLVHADMQRDVSFVRNALKVLKSHRETWVELGEKLKQENATTQDDAGGKAWAS